MWNKTKLMLSKVSGLLKTNNLLNNKRWPAYVLSTLEEKYHLTPKEMLRIWYIRRRISNGKYPIDSLFIYDWVKAREKKISVISIGDLYNNSDLLLFKGKIFGDGSIHLERIRDCENN